ncbi:peptide chain release factor N(5)-glutamine methyltransferase [Mycoplasma phocimorsus]|uniref:peptide chain release factor N(5)-glutamine methyltransferase n=1 Tax=Mycoplasma phocimorsus TaxID=3045839 RepID=UPI0024C0A21F|nr:peptide chain release factor N(5)-glutamine methyltransferase [Mycoplasma phocimorsus]MDJ1648408.1 peptide chain release factor N(5)-glutamine methyltransferase [Mycoplasma phocimorsus]
MANKEDLLREKRRYNLEEVISNEELTKIQIGMPIQKIMGYVDFFDTKIKIDKNVLIPRYETEEMVHLFYLREREKIYERSAHILDLCAGSGCIGLSLKNNFNRSVKVCLADNSKEAIEQIKINAQENNLDVEIIESNMFDNIKQKFDYIISNPPYISKKEQLPSSVLDFEPYEALFAENDGFFFYEEIIKNLDKFLNKDGKLYLEISDHIYNIFQNKKYKEFDIEFFKDMNEHWRFAIVEFKRKGFWK